MKSLIVLCALLLPSVTFANPRGQIKDNISRLARRVEIDVIDSEISNEELRKVQMQLTQALRALSGQDGSDYGQCLDFVLPIYQARYGSNTAIEKSKELCRSVSDTRVLEFIYNQLKSTNTTTTALSRAAEYSDDSVLGKVRIIEFAFDKHSSQYTTTSAIRKSVENARELEVGSMSCIRRFYSTHASRYSASTAMNKTVETCKEN
ncbi:hypothetical protein [Halobacteriovorax sp. HLS]|uniref:hypothetical protein n=1 Tax=Halobacteriovorax sp. HLS TaxID=2234000 RepID=UPI000FD84675|nr:hypothetical protein [Halobacteriovorax sp. HLS]